MKWHSFKLTMTNNWKRLSDHMSSISWLLSASNSRKCKHCLMALRGKVISWLDEAISRGLEKTYLVLGTRFYGGSQQRQKKRSGASEHDRQQTAMIDMAVPTQPPCCLNGFSIFMHKPVYGDLQGRFQSTSLFPPFRIKTIATFCYLSVE